MSQENVQIVRGVYEAAARRDGASVMALYDAEVEWDVSRSPMARLVGGGVYHGHEGLSRFFRAYHDAWESVEYEPEEVIDAGPQVVTVDVERSRGRASGIVTDLTQYAVWTVRDRKIVRVVWFPTREEALAAAGLEDQAMSQGNVEIVRRAYARWAARDVSAMLDDLDPDVEIRSMVTEAERTSYRGHRGFLDWSTELLGVFPNWDPTIQEIRTSADAAVIRLRVQANAVGSGTPVDQTTWQAVRFRDRKVVFVGWFRTQAEALAAAGLAE